MPEKTDYYDGPVCYVGEDGSATDINGVECEGGWHYTAVPDEELKALAVEHAQAQVDLWQKRAGMKGIGRFVTDRLRSAQETLASVQAMSFEVPGEKLHLEDTEDGSASRYRLATEKDERSWYDRKHQTFATIQPEDQADQGVRLSPSEFHAAMQAVEEQRQKERDGQ
jgi:hypothetical protein